MSPSRRPRIVLALAALAALPATGCIGPFRRALAPEQKVHDLAASRDCAVLVSSELGYLPSDGRDAAPTDTVREGRFTVERRGTTPAGETVVDQLTIRAEHADDAGEGGGRLRVVPARYVEDPQRALSPSRGVPRLRPPGPAEGAGRLTDPDAPRRRRVDSSVPRHDALEVTTRCYR